MKPILVTGYKNPDLDGFSSTVAYAEFLNKSGQAARPAVFGDALDEVKFMVERFALNCPKPVENVKEYERIALVDACVLSDLDPAIDPQKVVEVIDHRRLNDSEKFPNAKIQIEFVGACATLITEKFAETNTHLARKSAVLLYGAIMSNTLNFQSNTTTERDRAMAKWIKERIDLPDNFTHDFFQAKSALQGEKLKKTIEDDFKYFEVADYNIGIAQLEIVDGMSLVRTRRKEIIEILNQLQLKLKNEFVFLSIIDLEESRNIFITNEIKTQDLLSAMFELEFKEKTAVRPGLFMRKEFGPIWPKYYDLIKKLAQ